ncbi:MAG: PD-(D/E)XK nuclease family protein [Verrucomicrobiota bacterium]|jgi:ATP-dependent helicase/nuclease subunit B
MQARFLLGPAGTGKTFRCVANIRAALRENPEGPPLIFLAPKQATFQLERQLLSEAGLAGYTRLRILSFERLAEFVLARLREPSPPLLSEEGRVMVLRALLARRRAELRIFHASAGMGGFARELSLQLRELQQRGISPEMLSALAAGAGLTEPLRRKLADLALLQRDYLEWIVKHNVQDAGSRAALAAAALRRAAAGNRPPDGAGLAASVWLDGFGELTPQESGLLAALAPWCRAMTLAFCVDGERPPGADSWLSLWSAIRQAQEDCWKTLAAVPGVELETEILRRHRQPGRFAACPVMAHLEENWARPMPWSGAETQMRRAVRAVVCSNPEAEAILAAREILKFVRGGGRFRECAVVLRSLEGYHDPLRRIFSRYGIPFFLDRREPSAHHPLAELTRNALRVAAYDWRHEDWFSALKTGLVSDDEEAVDRLENEALARGWNGAAWTTPFPNEDGKLDVAERLRQQWVAPFLRFRGNVSREGRLRPTGPQLAAALRQLWRELRVEDSLTKGEAGSGLLLPDAQSDTGNPQLNATVWQQMNAWLDDLKLAFAGEALWLPEWLAVLEAGLGGFTVGVIPPALDQVLIGTVDRSRNPDLKLALVLGMNESVFPAPPPPRNLLTESDCAELAGRGLALGLGVRQLLSRERFWGYIACTRARERLVVTWAQQDAAGKPLNPSPFVTHLQKLFPRLELENFSGPENAEPEHPCELMPRLLRAPASQGWQKLLELPALAGLRRRMELLAPRTLPEQLSPNLAGRLYGPVLRTSVSRLELFAGCAFRFFVNVGLQAEERRLFELDARQKGSFQHKALELFHHQLQQDNKTWHDLSPAEARQRMGKICARLIPTFQEGLLAANAASRFAARTMAGSLEDFVAAMAEWMSQYEFEPCAAEVDFGVEPGGLPAWELDLGSGHRLAFRGRIDRIDLCKTGGGLEALVVVMDYKSSARKLEPALLSHGIQLQLPAYLSVLRRLPEPEKFFGVRRLIPAGVFYINLRGNFKPGETRDEVLRDGEPAWQAAYKHSGRFDLAALPHLDTRKAVKGTQFNFRLTKDGQPYANVPDPMDHIQFQRMLDQVEESLVRMGRGIFAGEIELNPYQNGAARACDHCEYQGICRIDPWTHAFRVLDRTDADEGQVAGA